MKEEKVRSETYYNSLHQRKMYGKDPGTSEKMNCMGVFDATCAMAHASSRGGAEIQTVTHVSRQ